MSNNKFCILRARPMNELKMLENYFQKTKRTKTDVESGDRYVIRFIHNYLLSLAILRVIPIPMVVFRPTPA
ncbi:MAG: hypothetical protein EWV57_16270 [Microcystis aeruginosa Ma_QC_Ch_20071001_S25D]|uniref:Uncharacterized protein n=1 Tax=Microcystis aeruginosa Ma_QC_Ch_20071001_S25D TaxID=2486250 RepID=A0A552FLI5_MICAE|nr:MAG: hypothetical protein EWV57_16270 [Microcystis aeruginosa Ma_QC_Ch_20071001_S25D]TRU67153.1 MAG: hypothetical protein EWV90_01080 [Microcystis aeruginosa Ma_QC_Ch_20071001_M135]